MPHLRHKSEIYNTNRGTKTLRNIALFFAISGAMMGSAYAKDDDEKQVKFTPESGFFVTAHAGLSTPRDAKYDGVQSPNNGVPGMVGAPANVRVEFSNGEFFGGSIGYRLNRHVFGIFQPSIEVEANYSNADVNGGSFNGGNQHFGGNQKAISFSLNYQSDIRWSDDQKIIPFTGGGIGVTQVENNILYGGNSSPNAAPSFGVVGSDAGLSLHNNIGLTYVINDNVELTARARYQRVSGLKFDRRFLATGGLNANVEGKYENLIFSAGIRKRF
ncbi:outer membrane beta-barrel protein [Sphingorhabdus lutea]|nr:outer membrane beta-barrel protein [Sphingorhabdus lutea]